MGSQETKPPIKGQRTFLGLPRPPGPDSALAEAEPAEPKRKVNHALKRETKDYSGRDGQVDNAAIVASPIMDLGGDKHATISSMPPAKADEKPKEDRPEDSRKAGEGGSPILKLFDEVPAAAPKSEEDSANEPMVSGELLQSIGAVAPPEKWPGVDEDAPGSIATKVESRASRRRPSQAQDEVVSRGWLFGAALAVGVGVGIAYFATRSSDTPSKTRASASATAAATSKPDPSPAPVESVVPSPPPEPAPVAAPSAAPSATAKPSASASPRPRPRPRPAPPPGGLPDIYEP